MADVVQIRDISVFNEYMKMYYSEQLSQNLEVFSSGALMIEGVANKGDFYINSAIKSLEGAVYDRDINQDLDQAPFRYTEKNMVGVKVANGWYIQVDEALIQWAEGSMEMTDTALQAIARNIGEQMSYEVTRKIVNDMISSTVGAMEGNTEAVVDVTAGTGADGEITQLNLNEAIRPFSDQKRLITTFVMNGFAQSDLLAESIANANQVYSEAGLTIMNGTVNGQGRQIIVTDSPALEDTDAGTYKVLCLVNGAVMASEASMLGPVMDNVQGKQNIAKTWQANWNHLLKVKGYSWDTDAGNDPTSEDLETSANWELNAEYLKQSAGTILIANARA